MRGLTFLMCFSLTGMIHADFRHYAGDSTQEALWRIAAGGNVPLENFESYAGVGGPGTGGDVLAAIPSLHVTFDPISPGVYDDGQWAHSGTKQWSNWAGGAGNSSSHVLRPEIGRQITALGFWNCDPQGDQPVAAYDASDQLIGTISGYLNDHNSDPAHSTGFAGFVSTVPIAYVRIPGSLGDGWNHFDDLQVVTQLVSADFNHDHTVDAADYVLWRKFDGTPAGYNLWRTHFGETVGSGSGASVNSAVPEPTILLLMLVATGCCFRRGHRKSQQLFTA